MNTMKSSGQPSGQSMPALSARPRASRTAASSAGLVTVRATARPSRHSTSATAVPLGSAARSTPTVSTRLTLAGEGPSEWRPLPGSGAEVSGGLPAASVRHIAEDGLVELAAADGEPQHDVDLPGPGGRV